VTPDYIVYLEKTKEARILKHQLRVQLC